MNITPDLPFADDSDQASNLRALHIPDEAYRAADEAYDVIPSNWTTARAMKAAIDVAAPAIVAAELRRLADQWWNAETSSNSVCTAARHRADELDGGGAR